MVRSAYVLAALLIPCAAVAQTITTTTQGPDGRTYTVTATQGPDGLNAVQLRQAPATDAPVGGVVIGQVGGPPRDTQPITGTSVIRGRVFDAGNGSPMRKAVVQIFGPELRENRSTLTDADGRYEFTDLPAGQFNISANKPGYVNFSYGQTAPNEMGKQLRLADKQVVEKIDFSLPRGAVITGRVLDEYGEPVPDAQVSPMRYQYTPSGPRPLNNGRISTTNDIGEFRLFGLSPGQYLISATSRGMNFNTPNDGGAGYATTYYPGTANPADAIKLTVGLGGGISDVTLMLVSTRTARVSGIVVDSQGRPLKQGSVMLMGRSGMNGMPSGGGMIRPDGTFVINGVAPGDYTVRAMMPGGQPGLPPESSVASVSVNGVDITDVRVEPQRPVTVTGRVVLDPVAARTFKPETVRLTATPNEVGAFFGPPPPPAAVHDDLTFEFKTAPGPSVVRVMAAGWMIKSVTLNGADVTDAITLPPDDVSGLEVELTNRVPDISGLVTDGKGDAVATYFAIAFPQEQERWNAPGQGRTAMVRADDQGRFRFRTLRPGNYYVVAVDHIQAGDWMDPAFMEAVHTHATRITVNEGDVQTLDLKLVQVQ